MLYIQVVNQFVINVMRREKKMGKIKFNGLISQDTLESGHIVRWRDRTVNFILIRMDDIGVL